MGNIQSVGQVGTACGVVWCPRNTSTYVYYCCNRGGISACCAKATSVNTWLHIFAFLGIYHVFAALLFVLFLIFIAKWFMPRLAARRAAGEGHMADGGDGEGQIADGEGQMADGEGHMGDGEGQMADGEGQMGDGGDGEGQMADGGEGVRQMADGGEESDMSSDNDFVMVN